MFEQNRLRLAKPIFSILDFGRRHLTFVNHIETIP